MNITKEIQGDTVTLVLDGKLNISTASELTGAVEAIAEKPATLIIDMQGVEYVASAGLRALVIAQKKMKAQDTTMILRNVCEDVMSVMEMTGLSMVFTFA